MVIGEADNHVESKDPYSVTQAMPLQGVLPAKPTPPRGLARACDCIVRRPCNVRLGAHYRRVLRLRGSSTSWNSHCAQDDNTMEDDNKVEDIVYSQSRSNPLLDINR
jgi:hypothetical protein